MPLEHELHGFVVQAAILGSLVTRESRGGGVGSHADRIALLLNETRPDPADHPRRVVCGLVAQRNVCSGADQREATCRNITT
jgi:hypothetical protein